MAHFNLKDGRGLGKKELVWVSTIHAECQNGGTDEGLQGEDNCGLQTHVHLLVKARDHEQKITLNPLGIADRFNQVAFQVAVEIELEVAVDRTTIGQE